MSADLHVHTNFSDGTLKPEEIVELAKKVGLKTIAITDHDVVAGVRRGQEKAEEVNVEVVPGIEMTTEAGAAEVHILGYYIDCNNAQLNEILGRIQKGREERIYKICDKLKGLGVDLDPEKVFAEAGHRTPGRPHVARALRSIGAVSNFKEAFVRYIDNKGPAYVPHYKLTPKEAIKIIGQAGGMSVFAHPKISDVDHIIPDLMADGLQGIEAYYPGYSEDEIKRYLTLAGKYGLLVTGGSDFHGPGSGRDIELGAVAISDELMDKTRNEYLRRN
ncbi:MAG: PHP domain-containing protein [Candidatus Margulisbacteria bacterium]|nr:PHP domain-containing protein [Candidatus Margulisiibacteriota bacterium]